MRLYRLFVGHRVAFPLGDTVAEGTLRAVDRTGHMWVSEVKTVDRNTEIELGDMVLPVPAWVRRLDNE